MTPPVVSILTTVFNREKYLSDCIESVLNSSFQDWEMLIVDDKSTDNSVKIAQSFANNDRRIKIFVNEINLGDYPNRNKAAEYAKGKYIKYLDADDIIYPHGLQIFVDTMEKFPEAALGISQEVYEDFIPFPFIMNQKETFIREFLKRGVLSAPPTHTIIKRQIFEELGRFSGTRYSGDTEMWLKIAINYPIVKIVPGLTFWRRHDEQEYKIGNHTNSYLILNYNLKLNFLNYDNCPLSDYEKKHAKHKLKFRHARNIINLGIIQKKPLEALKVYKKTSINLLDLIKSFFIKPKI